MAMLSERLSIFTATVLECHSACDTCISRAVSTCTRGLTPYETLPKVDQGHM